MNHTGRTSVGRRRQASRKRLVIGATRMADPSCLRRRTRENPLACAWPPTGGRSRNTAWPTLRCRCVRGVTDRNRYAALRRITRARVHDVAVDLAFRPEELLVAPGGGHRHDLSDTPRSAVFAGVLRVPDLHRPALRLVRRRAHPVNAAARPADQRDRQSRFASKRPPCGPPRSLCRCRPGPVPRPARSNQTVCAAAIQSARACSPPWLSAASDFRPCGRWPVPL